MVKRLQKIREHLQAACVSEKAQITVKFKRLWFTVYRVTARLPQRGTETLLLHLVRAFGPPITMAVGVLLAGRVLGEPPRERLAKALQNVLGKK